jgi:hypothetical protein
MKNESIQITRIYEYNNDEELETEVYENIIISCYYINKGYYEIS